MVPLLYFILYWLMLYKYLLISDQNRHSVLYQLTVNLYCIVMYHKFTIKNKLFESVVRIS